MKREFKIDCAVHLVSFQQTKSKEKKVYDEDILFTDQKADQCNLKNARLGNYTQHYVILSSQCLRLYV